MGSNALFWSYVHADDEREGGRIRRLASKLADEYEMLTGEELELFIDDRLKWGEAWRERIQTAIADSTFLVAIVTPSFFKSVECRKELLSFYRDAKEIGVADFLLPVRWSGVERLEEDDADEAKALVAKTQWKDWSALRLTDEDSPEHRTAVHDLAKRLVEIGDSAQPDPPDFSSLAGAAKTHRVDGPNEVEFNNEEAGGLLELSADIEEHMTSITSNLTRLRSTLETLAPEVTTAAQSFGALSRAKSPGARLVLANRFAKELEPGARAVQELGREYGSEFKKLDSAMRQLVSLVEVHPDQYSDAAGTLAGSLTDTYKQMAGMADAAESTMQLLTAIGSVSKNLRRVANLYNQGFVNYRDAQSLMEDWSVRLMRVAGTP